MAGLQRFFLVVAVGLGAIGALSAAPGDEAEVRAFIEDLSESRAQAKDLTSFYTEDATHIGPGGDWVRQPARVADVSARLDVESVSFLAERVALVGGIVAFRGAPAGEGALVERFTLVLERTGAGWKIAASRVTSAKRR